MTEPAPKKPDSPYPRGLKGLSMALSVAFSNAMRSGLFSRRHNLYAKEIGRVVIKPLRETSEDIDTIRAAIAKEQSLAPVDPLADLDPEERRRVLANCRRSWVFASSVAAAVATGLIVLLIMNGEVRTTVMLQCFALEIYAFGWMMRTARDHAGMIRRKTYSVREFLRDFDSLWCPLIASRTSP